MLFVDEFPFSFAAAIRLFNSEINLPTLTPSADESALSPLFSSVDGVCGLELFRGMDRRSRARTTGEATTTTGGGRGGGAPGRSN